MKPILIILSPYYRDIAAMLLTGARVVLGQSGHVHETVTVPGAFEIPTALAIAQRSGRYAGYVALGCVIRGDTSHYDIVCNESARGIMEFATRTATPVGLGILTCENPEQAILRADPAQGNKGGEAAQAVLALLRLKTEMGVSE